MSDIENMHLTEADQASYDSMSQILKAAMNYVEPPIGKALAVMAKSIELQHMMDYLNQDGVSACNVDGNQISPEEMLKDLRKYCGPKERAQLDRCLNMMNIVSVVQAMSNINTDTDGNSPDISHIMAALNNMPNTPQKQPPPQNTPPQDDYMNHLKSMLTPEQLQLFNSIASGRGQV